MGTWDNMTPVQPDPKASTVNTGEPPAPSGVWSSMTPINHSATGSTDPSKGFDPYSFLKSIPRQKGDAAQIDDLHTEFANRFALFSQDAQKLFPKYQISDAARLDGRGHTQNSRHYYGQAADVVPDWNFKKTPENLAALQKLADKHNLNLLDEWDESDNSHFHISMAQSTGKGNPTKAVRQVSGRQRSPKQIEGFARDYAVSQGVDPDIVTNILRIDTNYAKDHAGQDGTYGIAKLTPEQAKPFLDKMGKTWQDYLGNESLQVMTAVQRFKALVDPNHGGYGDNAKAVAAYQAGTDGVDRFQKQGKVDYVSTRDYVSRVLGIPEKKVDEAVAKGGVAPYDPAVVTQKAANQMGTDYSTGKQMLANAADMTVLPAVKTLGGLLGYGQQGQGLSSIGSEPNQQALIGKSYLPQLSFRESLTLNGTVDDSHWAAQNIKASINNGYLNLPGVFFESMRPDNEYNKWRSDVTTGDWVGGWAKIPLTNMHIPLYPTAATLRWAGLGMSDLIGSMPVMGALAQYAIPKMLGKAGQVAGAAGGSAAMQAARKGTASALTWMAENIPYARTVGAVASMPGNIPGNLKNTALGYLMDSGMFNQVAGWATTMGFNAMNLELQRQFNDGKNLTEAMPHALAAARNDAAMTGLFVLGFPLVGGSALALLKSGFQAGPKAMSEIVANMRAGKLFGEQGPKMAEFADNMWGMLPEGGRKAMARWVDEKAKQMSYGEKGWFGNLVKDSARYLAQADNLAKNESAHVASVDALKAAADEQRYRLQAFDDGVKTAQETAQKAQVKVDTLQKAIKDLPARDATNSVNMYLSQEQQLADLRRQQAAGVTDPTVGPNGQQVPGKPLVDPKGQLTPAGKSIERDLQVVQKKMADLEVHDPKNPGGYWVQKLLRYRRLLNGTPSDPGALQQLAAAQQNFFLNNPDLSLLRRGIKFGVDNLDALHKEATDALSAGKIPDHSKAIATVPVPSNATADEAREFTLLQSRLLDRANMAIRNDTDAGYVPLVQQELTRQVDTALMGSAGQRASMMNQISVVENAGNALKQLKARSRSSKLTGTLERAIADVEKFKESLSGKVEFDPKSGAEIPGSRRPGALHFTSANIKDILTGKDQQTTGAVYPKGVPSTTAADLVDRILAIRTPEFPNGLPIGAFAEKGLKYAAQDPKTIALTDDALSQAASTLISESSASSMSMVRAMLEGVARGEIDGAVTRTPYSLLERFGNYGIQLKQAMDTVLNARAKNLDHPDAVFRATQYFSNFMMSYEKAGLRVADDVMQEFTKKATAAAGMKPGQRFPREFEHEFAIAVEGGREEVIKFLQKTHDINGKKIPGSKFVEPMQMYFDVMASLERYKVQSPDSKDAFRYNYFLHSYPRLLRYLQKGSEDVKRLSISAPWEKQRSVESIKQSLIDGEKAWADVQALSKNSGKEFKTWEEYAYGAKTMEERARRLGVAEEQAALYLKKILLGDVSTAPGEVLHNVVHSTMRADATRHFLRQLQVMEHDGLPLLIDRKNPKFARMLENNQKAPFRKGTTSAIEEGEYTAANTVPGISGYFGENGKDMMIHPQARYLIESYLMSGKHDSEGVLRSAMNQWRSLSLAGSPFNYLFSIMSNYTSLVGFNFAKAYGLIPLGEMVREESPMLMLRAIGAGLQPASLLRNAAAVPQDLMQAAKDNPLASKAFHDAWGTHTPLSKAMEGSAGKMPGILTAPLRFVDKMDSFLNKIGLFRALTDAQLGAWTFYTGNIMKNHGAKLLEEQGGRYGAALMVAERMAADHVNRLAGVLPYHMMSDTMRSVIYSTALAPQYASAKWDTLVEAFDHLLLKVGHRSRNAWKPSEVAGIDAARKSQLSNFLVGGMMSSILYSNMLSYAINGHSTFANPTGHEFDIRVGKDTYISNPLFGMFRSVMKGFGSLAMNGEPERAFNAFIGQLHPVFQTVYEFGRNKDPMTGAPIRPESMKDIEWWKAMGSKLAEKTFNLGDFGYREGTPPPGMGALGSQTGVPMENKEWIFQILGANPSRGVPMEIQLSNEVNKHLAYAKSQMSEQIRVRLQLANRYPEGSDEQKKILNDTIEFAMKEGVPTGNKGMKEYLKSWNPKGNYVMMDVEALMHEIDASMSPNGEAYKRVPERMRPMLYDMISKHMHEAAVGYLQANREKYTPADIDAEINRRMGGYYEAYPKFLPIDYRPIRVRGADPKKGGYYAAPNLPVYVQTRNPVDNDKVLKVRQR